MSLIFLMSYKLFWFLRIHLPNVLIPCGQDEQDCTKSEGRSPKLQPGESFQTKTEIIFQYSLSKVRSISVHPKRIIHSCTNFTKCVQFNPYYHNHTHLLSPWHYFVQILPMSPNIPFANMFLRFFQKLIFMRPYIPNHWPCSWFMCKHAISPTYNNL